MDSKGKHTQKHVDPKKKHVFVIDKCVEDVKQDQKIDPDLLEAIMEPTDPVKEELWRKTMKMGQCRPEVTKIRVSTFGCPENRRIPAGGQHSLRA